jgi:ABC-type lipoprotein release transport system permease subunit
VPFNPDQEQLGIKLNAMAKNDKDLKFNIYGIENNNRFLDLRDHQGNDLMETLFKSRDTNALVINQSMAVKFNLKVGDEADFDIMYQELQKDNLAYGVND